MSRRDDIVMKLGALFIRFVLSAVSAIGIGTAAAIVIAVADLYLTGHGYGSITREWITWEPAGVHLSPGDVILLVAATLAGGLTWHLSGRGI